MAEMILTETNRVRAEVVAFSHVVSSATNQKAVIMAVEGTPASQVIQINPDTGRHIKSQRRNTRANRVEIVQNRKVIHRLKPSGITRRRQRRVKRKDHVQGTGANGLIEQNQGIS